MKFLPPSLTKQYHRQIPPALKANMAGFFQFDLYDEVKSYRQKGEVKSIK